MQRQLSARRLVGRAWLRNPMMMEQSIDHSFDHDAVRNRAVQANNFQRPDGSRAPCWTLRDEADGLIGHRIGRPDWALDTAALIGSPIGRQA
jgi:hypothetical protein